MIAAVVLAAGLSRRMGQPKLLLPLGSKTVIEHVVLQALRAKVGEIIVVVGEHAQAIGQMLSGYAVTCIHNSNYMLGQGASVAAGAAAVSAKAEGILFLNGDQPLVTAELLNALIDTFAFSRPKIAAHRGKGPPILFNIAFREELMQLAGDIGGRPLLEKYPDAIVRMSLQPGHQTMDLDTSDDYVKMCRLWERLHSAR